LSCFHKKNVVTIKRVHKGDPRNGTKCKRRETNDTSLGQLYRLMYTSGIITIRKRKQISVTVEDKLCCKTLKNVTVKLKVKVKVLTIHAVKAYGGVKV